MLQNYTLFMNLNLFVTNVTFISFKPLVFLTIKIIYFYAKLNKNEKNKLENC